MRTTHSRLALLVLALLLGLLLAAGPATATDPFLGDPPAYGWHTYNCKAVWMGVNDPDDPTESYFRVTSKDEPRLNGDLTAYLAGFFPYEGDYWHVTGSYYLENDAGDGGWTGAFDHLLSTGFLEGKSHGISIGVEHLYGFGVYDGLVAHQRGHAAVGPPSYWIMKGWIEELQD